MVLSFQSASPGVWIKHRFLGPPSVQFSSVTQLCPTLRPHGQQHTRPPCPSPTPRVYPLSRWCHPTISSSVVLFSSCPQSFPASGSFPMSQLFASGGQNIGVSASTSVLPMNTQDWSPLWWTGWAHLGDSDLVILKWSPRICISPGFLDAADLLSHTLN